MHSQKNNKRKNIIKAKKKKSSKALMIVMNPKRKRKKKYKFKSKGEVPEIRIKKVNFIFKMLKNKPIKEYLFFNQII